jgi:hypothetical protein
VDSYACPLLYGWMAGFVADPATWDNREPIRGDF